MTKKYQVTELDKVVEQVKGFSEWTNEDQLEHQLRFQEESHKKAFERMAVKNAELYTDNVLLKREIEELKKPNHYEMGNELLMRDIEVLKTKVKKGKEFNSKLLEGIIDTLVKEIIDLKLQVKFLHEGLIPVGELNDTLQLEEYRKLQSEVHSDIEKVWMYDATLTKDLSAYQKRKRSEAIERVFYKIANQWI